MTRIEELEREIELTRQLIELQKQLAPKYTNTWYPSYPAYPQTYPGYPYVPSITYTAGAPVTSGFITTCTDGPILNTNIKEMSQSATASCLPEGYK